MHICLGWRLPQDSLGSGVAHHHPALLVTKRDAFWQRIYHLLQPVAFGLTIPSRLAGLVIQTRILGRQGFDALT